MKTKKKPNNTNPYPNFREAKQYLIDKNTYSMNQKCAIAKALLEGMVLSTWNGFQWFGCTNLPREIPRSIEREFGVKVSRVSVTKETRYGQQCSFTEYRLNRTEYNKPGILEMEKYVQKIEGVKFTPKVRCGPKRHSPRPKFINATLPYPDEHAKTAP